MSTLKKQIPAGNKAKSSIKTTIQLENPKGVGNIMDGLDKAITEEKKKEVKKKVKKELPKLPIGFKKRWLKALRSGEFVQVNGDLASKSNDTKINITQEEIQAQKNGWGYCVLGVAGKIAGYSDTKLKNAGGALPHNFDKIPDILKTDKGGDNHEIADKLIEMNDTKEATFAKIADWIDVNL